MRERSFVLIAMLIVCMQGCHLVPRTSSHQFKEDKVINAERHMLYWGFRDLGLSMEDALIVVEAFSADAQAVMIKNQNMDVYSQITLPNSLVSYNVVENQVDGTKWLFISYNDKKKCYLQGVKYTKTKALERESRLYETIDRTDSLIDDPDYVWYGSMTPVMLQDIDGDKKADLVCLGSDSFTSNPRGIFVYDFETGRLKWRHDTSACISSLILADFDLDGKDDLIASTVALKNNGYTINGTTDFAPVIFACNAQGKMIYLEECFEGFGQVALEFVDLDNDGKKEIIRVDNTWGTQLYNNSVSIIESNGKRFLTKKKYETDMPLSRQSKFFVTHLDASRENHIFLTSKKNGLIVLDKNLQQREHNLCMGVKRLEAIEDIDNDNKKEILAYGGNNEFLILDSSLHLQAKLKNPFPNDDDTQACIVKTAHGNPMRIAVISHMGIVYYDYTLLPWHQLFGQWLQKLLPVVSAFLLLIIIILGSKSARCRKREEIYLNQSIVGIMVVSKRKVIRINQAMLANYWDSQGVGKQDLRQFYQNNQTLYREIKAFCESKASSASKDVILDSSPDYPCNLIMHRLSHHPCRIMVMLSTVMPELDCNAEKLQWAEISRRLSHHVRRHISNILLALNILEESPDISEQAAKREMIKCEIDRIKRFTQAFQRFTEMGDYQLQLVDIIPWLENSINRFHMPDNIEVIKDWTLASLPTLIEPIRFEEVMVNLLTNAIESMPDGGSLRVSVTARNGSKVLIEIEDSGVGIPSKYLEDIWKPFFTTKRSGTGIGLAEVKKMLESMQGEIEIVSEEGVGTTVSILLKGESQ